MTILKAMMSGKPFRRPHWDYCYIVVFNEIHKVVGNVSKPVKLSYDNLITKDWIIE